MKARAICLLIQSSEKNLNYFENISHFPVSYKNDIKWELPFWIFLK